MTPPTDTGGDKRSSTRSTRAASPTRTATAWATSQGITSRVPYLGSLGIDAVWLSPFYPSALADGGYDVDDYRNVDPNLGTLADFDEMAPALHAAGIKLIVDIVPNHSSNRHEWFQEALASPQGRPPASRYIFRDGRARTAQPPADWDSMFGGPRLDSGRRRPVVPAPASPPSSRTSTGTTRRSARTS